MPRKRKSINVKPAVAAKAVKPKRVRHEPLQLPASEMEVGVDSVGRGCLFGPIVAGAVIMPTAYKASDELYQEIRDSKKLTAKKRELLAEYIRKTALAWGLGDASAEEVDRDNVLQADLTAMHRALDRCYAQRPFGHVLVDGDKFRPYVPFILPSSPPRVDEAQTEAHPEDCEPAQREPQTVPHTLVVGGDNLHLNIAAGAILAKVYRDQLMADLVQRHPEMKVYQLDKNKGYGTAQHVDALKQHGPIPKWHRYSFAPVAAAHEARCATTLQTTTGSV